MSLKTWGLALAVGVLGLFAASTAQAQTNPRIEMVVEKRGTLTFELLSDKAPKTVAHILKLVDKKFYDGILFHRVVYNPQPDGTKKGFVAQAGDPKSRKVKGETIANIPWQETGLGDGGSDLGTVPLEANVPHDKGTLGLARSSQPDSGDSQFFINLEANHFLDANYCVFGKIVSGQNLMGKIKQGDRIKSIRVVKKKK